MLKKISYIGVCSLVLFSIITSAVYAIDEQVLMQAIQSRADNASIVPPATPVIQRAPEVAGIEGTRDIEKMYQLPVSFTLAKTITQFGYDFFKNVRVLPDTSTAVQVGPDYILGVGDMLDIFIWGKVQEKFSVTIERDGTVFLPKAGKVRVAGLSYGRAEEFIKNNLSQYFANLEVSVVISRLRTMNVYVMGEVKVAGIYQVPAMMNILNVLYLAGGPNNKGSLRNIQVLRNNQVVANIDLYDYFVYGRRSQHYVLREDDAIFVPVIGNTAGVAGNVKRPGIYELKGQESFQNVIDMAGGLTAIGNTSTVLCERAIANRREVLSLEMDKTNKFSGAVADGDLIMAGPIVPADYKIVVISGEVHTPGRYLVKSDEKLSSLIERAGGYTGFAFLDGAVFTRKAIKIKEETMTEKFLMDQKKRLIQLQSNLDAAAPGVSIIEQTRSTIEQELLGKAKGRLIVKLSKETTFKNSVYDISLEDEDDLQIPPIPASVQIMGGITNPGSVVCVGNQSVIYYVKTVGGLTKYADRDNMFVLKANGEVATGWDYMPMPGDTIMIPEEIRPEFNFWKLVVDLVDVTYKVALTWAVVNR